MRLTDTECMELRDLLQEEIYRIERKQNQRGKPADLNIIRLRHERQLFLIHIMRKLHNGQKAD